MHDEGEHGEHEEDMNQKSCRVKDEKSSQPQHDQNNRKNEKHPEYLLSSVIASTNPGDKSQGVVIALLCSIKLHAKEEGRLSRRPLCNDENWLSAARSAGD